MNVKGIILASLTAILAMSTLSSCRFGEQLSSRDRDRFVARLERQLADELDLNAAQKEALTRSVSNARKRLDSRPLPDPELLSVAREAFVSGGEEMDRVLATLAEEREADSGFVSRRKTLRSGLKEDIRPFLDSLTPEQRGKLFDLAARRRT